MITKEQWQKVVGDINYDDIGKADYIVPTQFTRMNKEGKIGDMRFGNVEQQVGASRLGLMPNEHALAQFSSRLGVPAKYAKKMFDENPQYMALHYNYWLEKLAEEAKEDSDRQFLLRAKNDTMRAVLTDKYAQLDNSFVMDALSANLDKGAAVNVTNFALSDKYLNLRLIFPDLSANVGTSINRDDVMVGIHITNSEVGSSALRIDSCLFRLVCSNGMIARVGGDSLMNQRHVHLTRGEMENRVADAISESLKVGDGLIEDFARTKEVAVNNPMKVLEELAKKQKYSEAFTDSLKNSFNSDPHDSAFGIVNAFTHASKELPFERRVEVETFAGKVMQDFLGDSHKINKALPVVDDYLDFETGF